MLAPTAARSQRRAELPTGPTASVIARRLPTSGEGLPSVESATSVEPQPSLGRRGNGGERNLVESTDRIEPSAEAAGAPLRLGRRTAGSGRMTLMITR